MTLFKKFLIMSLAVLLLLILLIVMLQTQRMQRKRCLLLLAKEWSFQMWRMLAKDQTFLQPKM